MSSEFDIQRKIVANMTSESWKNIPHVAFSYEPDITLYEARFKENRNGVSFNTLLMHDIAQGLKHAPKMNAHFSYNKWLVSGRIEEKKKVDISMPAILPDGRMMTLNIHNCDSLSIEELQKEIDDVMARAGKSNLDEAMMSTAMENTINALKQGKIVTAMGRLIGRLVNPHCAKTYKGKQRKEYYRISKSERLVNADVEQGSVTVSNFGSLYKNLRGRPVLLEIVPPQTTAIGIGAIQDVNGRRILPMCIAFDHRALDFGDIIPFIKYMDSIMNL